MATTPKELTGAQSVEWDLSDLYEEGDEARLRSDLDQELLFFDLEWLAVDDERADAAIGATAERYRGFLRATRRYRPHVLSEPEERLDTVKDLTGRSAWTRLHEQLVAELRVQFDGENVSLNEALARLMTSAGRDDRRRVAEGIGEALAPGLRTRAYILNTIAAERAAEDRLRGYPTWISARNLANRISDDAAQHLVEAIVDRRDIAHRAFALKAKLLGLPRLADYDRYAPVATVSPSVIPWDDARDLVVDAFASFSPRAGEIVEGFFDDRRIDAAVRDGKSVGAFCRSVAERRPYVLLSYTGEPRSVLVLAHELGHALHGVLANDRGVLSMRAPLTLAETASVFAEALVFRSVYEREHDPAARLELLSRRIDDSLGTVFRQIAYNRFEDAVHTARRTDGELSVEQFGGLWTETSARANGPAVELTDGFRSWWSFIPHFVFSPGYVYAYAFGYLFSMAVYQRYLREGDAIVEPLFDLLGAGGSAPPAELAQRLGFDLDDPGLWSQGLDAIDALVDEAEALSAEVDLPVSRDTV